MPCFTMQTIEQTLENIKDINLLAEGLREMGYRVDVRGDTLSFSGNNKLTGEYSSGNYAFGRLTTQQQYATPDTSVIRKFVGVATVKKNAKQHKWTLTPVKGNPFAFTIQK